MPGAARTSGQEGLMSAKIEKAADWFDTILPETVAQYPGKVGGFEGTISFTIAGESGGEWAVTFAGNKAVVRPGADPTAAFSVKMKDESFVKMMNGELSGPEAFMTGKLKLKGAVPQVMKLHSLLFG
jgi:putative sterol carrier protein